MPGELIVATLNLWGLNGPQPYMTRRGEVRGALPGSPATTMVLPDGAWPSRRRRLAADALRLSRATLIGLQEDHQSLAESAQRSQSEQLAADLGCTATHITTVREGSARKGIAVLSHHPIRRTQRLPLPPGEGEAERFGPEARDVLHAAVETPVGVVHFFVIHLTTRGHGQQLEEASQLLAHVERIAVDGTAVVVGDFNAVPTSPTLSLLTSPTASGFHLRDAWTEANGDAPGFTMPIHSPRTLQDTHMRIDYILVGAGPHVAAARLYGDEPDSDGFYPSDHFGVAVTLRWQRSASRSCARRAVSSSHAAATHPCVGAT